MIVKLPNHIFVSWKRSYWYCSNGMLMVTYHYYYYIN